MRVGAITTPSGAVSSNDSQSLAQPRGGGVGIERQQQRPVLAAVDIREVDARVRGHEPEAVSDDEDSGYGPRDPDRLSEDELDEAGVLLRHDGELLGPFRGNDVCHLDEPVLGLRDDLARDNKDIVSREASSAGLCQGSDDENGEIVPGLDERELRNRR